MLLETLSAYPVPISSLPSVMVPEAAIIPLYQAPCLRGAHCQPRPLPKSHGFGPCGAWPCGTTVWYHKVSSWAGGMETDIHTFGFY